MKLFIAILASMFFANIAEACRCRAPQPTEENISQYQNIARVVPFELKVINFIENTEEDMAVEGIVKVLEIYKGSAESVIPFKSASPLSSCGPTINLGRDYVIFWNDDISPSSCTINWTELNRIDWPRFKGNRPPLVNHLTNTEIINEINKRKGL
jgi:hypothetical protein